MQTRCHPAPNRSSKKAFAECLWLLADEYQVAGCKFNVLHPGITFPFGGRYLVRYH
jgi:hypothetical protein